MLITNPVPVGGHRHNYVWLILLAAAPLLFIGHIAVHQLAERGNNSKLISPIKCIISIIQILALFPNLTLRAEEVVLNNVTPSEWVYRALDAFNYIWQVK